MARPNPFPGMNPYMVKTWPDVHVRLIGLILEALGAELPDDLVAKGELLVEVLGEPAVRAQPDISVVGEEWKGGLPPVWSPSPEYRDRVVTEPTLVTVDRPKHRWVAIRTAEGSLVTVIEVVSPANKGRNRAADVSKRDSYVAAAVNVVEIDLIRGGAPVVDFEGIEDVPGGQGEHYYICVSRAAVPGRREIYPCPLRERLPVIRVPLRLGDPDIPLDIQSLVDRCYQSGRYWMLDYSAPPNPPFSSQDAAWAEERLRAAGLI